MLMWDIPLKACPTIVQMHGRAEHGWRGIEHYRLNRIWCLNLYQGSGELQIAGHVLPIRPGYASITVPDHDMSYRYDGRAYLTWVHFIPETRAGTVPIPGMQNLGREFDRIRMDLERAAAIHSTHPERAAARVWETLWQIVDLSERARESTVHPALQKTFELINQRLAQSITIEHLAAEAGLSQTHLNRLFHSTVGSTVSQYIRSRRMERARHLLLHSTLPVKSIAAQVGIPDPHLFNKTVRKELGAPPSKIRRRGPAGH
jgi:AraC-like DNA-binding protein